jgi:NADH-quinone oxidoreductase subunit M
MINHGLITGALFLLVGVIYERTHDRTIAKMGGLSAPTPVYAAVFGFFVFASAGLPGLSGFVGEFLVLLGTFAVNRPIAIVAAIGLVTAAIYSLILVQRALHGEPRGDRRVRDLNTRETGVLVVLVIVIVALGVYPQPVLHIAAGGVANVQQPQTPRPALGAAAP